MSMRASPFLRDPTMRIQSSKYRRQGSGIAERGASQQQRNECRDLHPDATCDGPFEIDETRGPTGRRILAGMAIARFKAGPWLAVEEVSWGRDQGSRGWRRDRGADDGGGPDSWRLQ